MLLWEIFPDFRERQKEKERWSCWVVTPEDERTFSLGVLEWWRRVLPQLCCSCLNSIQDFKRKTQLGWLLTQQALAMVNNSSSVAHVIVLFTLRINKFLLWVCVTAVKCFTSEVIKNAKILKPDCDILQTVCICNLSFNGENKELKGKWWYLLFLKGWSVMYEKAPKWIVCETLTCAGSEC